MLSGGGKGVRGAERRACEIVGLARSTFRYQRRTAADEVDLRARIRTLANEQEAYGYRMITNLLQREGWQVNVKRVHRLWKEEGLQQPRHRPRRRYLEPIGEIKQRAQYAERNHVWSYDFVEDRTTRGGQLRVLCVLYEYTRECLSLLPDRSISSRNVVQVLDWLCLLRGVPEHIRSDNGPEFIAQRVRQWLAERECDTIFITPGSPWENPYIESFIGTLSRECLDRYLFDESTERT